jgi:hypothetical protein
MAPQTSVALPLALSNIIGLLGRLAVVLRYFLSALTLNVQVFESEHVSLVFTNANHTVLGTASPLLR